MKDKLFNNIFLISASLFFCCALIAVFFMHSSEQNATAEFLKNEAEYIVGISEETDIKKVSNRNCRITLISPAGDVLFDSNGETLSNQSDCEEINKAIYSGEGESRRDGNLYFAVLTDDGNILRLQKAEADVWSILLKNLPFILLGIILAAIVSAYASKTVSNSIVESINRINFENPDPSVIYPEFRLLLNRIREQNKKISSHFKEIKDEHSKQDKMRREFTANVSHELKTPLTSISGYAEIMRDGIAKPEDITRFSGIIYDESQRLMHLVEDIINLSRLEDDSSPQANAKIDLLEICESTADNLQKVADRANISLSVEGEKTLISGNIKIVSEMIYNLCDNAIKYNVEGGSVKISVFSTEHLNCVRVSDTGIGIAESETGRIFERFYRVDKSRSKEVGGTGLGLSIVKHGAAYHHASITVESKLGKGTEITVSFPKKD